MTTETQFTTLKEVNVFDPNDGEHWVDIEIEWRRVSKGYKAFLNEGGLGYPAEGPEWEIGNVSATRSP